MQLTARTGALLAFVAGSVAASPAAADEGDETVALTTTWYQEQRQGGLGGLTVIHPQASLGVGGEHVAVDLGYAADVVSGATATVYSVDAVSSATTFSDVRHQASVGLSVGGDRSRLGITSSVGVERDYVSLALGGRASVDLPGRNTNLVLSYTHGFDAVCDKDNAMATPLERRALTGADPCAKSSGIFGADTAGVTVWRDLAIDTAQVTLNQNVSPTMNLQLSTFGQLLDGLQSNPYRRVQVGNTSPQEYMPEVRARLAVALRLNRYIEALHAATHLDVRGYSDTWGVNAGTVELAYSQYVGSSLLLRLRARAYQQTAATFFKDAFFYETESTAGSYFTGDRELSPVRNAVVGGKLTLLSVAEDDKKVWGLFDRVDWNLKADVFLLDELPADDEAANLGGRATQFLSSDQLLDAFELQLGLRTAW